ncbi:MAG TPA: response regulator transcription factor [Acidimicrobiales bacterium]|nr:response regulator transcription factor [Acidimicrobiales bacterium]
MGTPPPTVLLVDPDDASVRAMGTGLEAAGLRTVRVGDGESAVELFAIDPPDLVLLELVLPDQPGLEVCRRLRERGPTPIVVLTSRYSELDVAVALEVGADDYVVKPVDERELLARVRGLLRRAQEQERRQRPTAVLQVGDVRLDLSAHAVWVGDRPVDLTLKEFAVLRMLLERAGRIVPRRTLVQEVWGPPDPGVAGSAGSVPPGRSATLDAHMRRLRAKLEGGGAAASRITTFRKLGYRFETEEPR